MEFCTVKEASKELSVSERWIQMMCKNGRIVGANRVNESGSWMIPSKWVDYEKKYRIQTKKKGVDDMKKIALVFDDKSVEIGEKIYSDFVEDGVSIDRKGIIPTYSDASEDEIVDALYNTVYDVSYILGISSSGNGIAIYANKLRGYNATPIRSLEEALQYIDMYSANAFDISSGNENIFSIYKKLVEKIEGKE